MKRTRTLIPKRSHFTVLTSYLHCNLILLGDWSCFPANVKTYGLLQCKRIFLKPTIQFTTTKILLQLGIVIFVYISTRVTFNN